MSWTAILYIFVWGHFIVRGVILLCVGALGRGRECAFFFRLLRGITVSRALGDFDRYSHLLTGWRLTDTFKQASLFSIDRESVWYLAMCVFVTVFAANEFSCDLETTT